MSASFEASFVKALQLLHSPDKEATDQLKTMLDECLAQKKAPPAAPATKQPSVTTIKPVVSQKQVAQPVAMPTPLLVPSDDIDNQGCLVCKIFDQKPGNEIVQCQECHSLYHQECHKPSLANENVRDPRFVWYCSTCTSKRKKAKLPGKTAVPNAANGSVSKEQKEHQSTPEMSPFKSWSFLKK